MAKITNQVITEINELYYINKNYSQTARDLGISPSSVKKYVISGYTPKSEVVVKPLDKGILEHIEDYVISKEEILDPNLLRPTEEEVDEIVEFWKEVSI